MIICSIVRENALVVDIGVPTSLNTAVEHNVTFESVIPCTRARVTVFTYLVCVQNATASCMDIVNEYLWAVSYLVSSRH